MQFYCEIFSLMANTKNHAFLSDQKIFALIVGLCDEISKTSSPENAATLLAALLTPQEIRMLSIRLRIREMLLGGKKYEQIKADLGASAGTISRVRLALEHLDERPRSLPPIVPKAVALTNASSKQTAKHPQYGSMTKYAANDWPIQLLASILRQIAEKRPPP
jgi:uncharacterized protein YerC